MKLFGENDCPFLSVDRNFFSKIAYKFSAPFALHLNKLESPPPMAFADRSTC